MRPGVRISEIRLIGLALALVGTGFAPQARSAPGPMSKSDPACQTEGGSATNQNDRLKLDPSKVLALQMQALDVQRAEDEAAIHPCNCFTKWLDGVHEHLYRGLDNAVRWLDTKWAAADTPYEYQLSHFKLNALARVGGRSSDSDFEYKLRFRGDLALPGLERRLHLTLDTDANEDLPGADPLKRPENKRLGLRAMLKELKNSELNLGGGLKWRDSRVVTYTSLEWDFRQNWAEAVLRLSPRVFFYSDDGFGQKTVLTWTRPAGHRKLFQILSAERVTEKTKGFEFEQSLKFAWLRSGKGRGWIAQASVFPHLKSDGWFWDDALLNITWRDALYRKWIYYTVTPQVQFPREDDYNPQPSLRIGLEILFGGETGELI